MGSGAALFHQLVKIARMETALAHFFFFFIVQGAKIHLYLECSSARDVSAPEVFVFVFPSLSCIRAQRGKCSKLNETDVCAITSNQELVT